LLLHWLNYLFSLPLPVKAEASREARAKIIASEGEQKASRALREASEIIGDSPAALQLRYLQVNLIKKFSFVRLLLSFLFLSFLFQTDFEHNFGRKELDNCVPVAN